MFLYHLPRRFLKAIKAFPGWLAWVGVRSVAGFILKPFVTNSDL